MTESQEPLQPLGYLPHKARLALIAAGVGLLDLAVTCELESTDPFTHEQRYALRGLGFALKQALGHAQNLRETLPPANP